MRRIAQVVLVILIIAGLGLAGSWLYQAGYAQGASADGTGPVSIPGPGFGFGFAGLFGILGFLLFLFLLFGLLRFAFRGPGSYGPGWGGGRPGHGYGPWDERARAIHDDWHRRSDASAPASDRGASPLGASPEGS